MGSIPREERSEPLERASTTAAAPRRLSKGHLWKFLAEWLAATAEDASMTKNDLRVGIMLATYSQMHDSAAAYMESGRLDCWPAIDTIARRLSISRSTVKRSVGRLVAAGRLRVTVRRGRDLTNLYRLVIPDGKKRAEAGGKTARSGGHKTGRIEPKTGRNEPVKRVALGDPLYPSLREGKKGPRDGGAAPGTGAGAPRRRGVERSSGRRPDISTEEGWHARVEALAQDLDEDDENADDENAGGDALDAYEELKQKRPSLSKEEFVALVEEYRASGRITRGDRSFLMRKARKD